MRRLRTRAVTWILTALMAISGSMMSTMDAMAATLQIGIDYHADGNQIGGAQFSVSEVASGDDSGGTYIYTLLEAYESTGLDPNTLGDNIRAAAKAFAACNVQAAETITTAADGTCTYVAEEPGLYLIRQTGRTDSAQDYALADPMLVYLPAWDADNSAWKSTVNLEPKTVKTPDDGDGGGNDGGDDDDHGHHHHGGNNGGNGSGNKTTNTPGQPTTSVTPDNNSTVEQTSVAQTQEETASSVNNQTGDDCQMLLYGSLAMISMVAFAVYCGRHISKKGTGRGSL